MSDVVIRAEGLGKCYLIGHHSAEPERYTALRDVLARSLKGFGRSALDMMRGQQIITGDEVEEFWALKDVSFEVRCGEVVGIIGRNGAGKSTLLKVLSRITEPSEGRVEIRGRIACLLEVGTGFHPELTGRENIYLNGAILGMTRAEIHKKFDEIVAFAEVDKFLDTPVKRYSSGMYMRLAFSVAAHLESEILIVDEVLAVGDAEFQKKCLGKMQDVAGHGRTVLFVSHNMGAVQTLCHNAILLKNGKISTKGSTDLVLKQYASLEGSRTTLLAPNLQVGSIEVVPPAPRSKTDLQLRMKLIGAETEITELAILLYSASGTRAAIIDARKFGVLPLAIESGEINIIAKIRGIPLVEGDYSIGLYLVSDRFSGNIHDLGSLTVFTAQSHHSSPPYPAASRGIVELDCSVSVSMQEEIL